MAILHNARDNVVQSASLELETVGILLYGSDSTDLPALLAALCSSVPVSHINFCFFHSALLGIHGSHHVLRTLSSAQHLYSCPSDHQNQ